MEGVRDTDPEKGTKERKARLEKKRGMKLDDHPQYAKEALDPVGKEDGDVDNDGDKDSSDKYLLKRRKAIGKAMKKRLKEERESLSEVIDDNAPKTVKEKKVNNKVIINPKLGEAVEEMGGTLIEHIEVDEMDFIVESVYDELIEEGYSEDDVEAAIENAMEATVTFGHDTKALKKDGSQVGSRRKFLKRKAKAFLGNMAAKAYNKGREAYKSKVEPKLQRAKTSAKRGIRKAAQKVVDKMSEEVVDEAVYGGTPAKKEAPKDTRMTVTAADKKGNTPAYQKFKAGDKRYKAADHLGEDADLDNMQKDADANRARAAKLKDRNVTRGSASLAAAKVADDVKKAARTGPQQHKGTRTGVKKIEKPKPTHTKTGAMRVEETEDSLRDRRMERGGVDGNTRYDRAPKAPNTKKFGTGKTMAQKEMEKKYGKGASAMDVVKAQIRAKHGKGAIMDTKKK